MLASQWVWQRTKSVSIPAEEQNAGRVVDYFYRMEFHTTPRFFSDSNYLFLFFSPKMAILPNMAKTVKMPLFHYFFAFYHILSRPYHEFSGHRVFLTHFWGFSDRRWPGNGQKCHKRLLRQWFPPINSGVAPLDPPFSSTSVQPCRMPPRRFLHSSPPKNTSTSVACASACFPTLSDRGVVELYFLVF